jgi:enoyl-CoA hydratase/carnithine racemase
MTNPAHPDLPQAGVGSAAASPQAEFVRVQMADRIATITLDSPANANALSTALVAQLRSALDRALADSAVRVIVLTGAGRVF